MAHIVQISTAIAVSGDGMEFARTVAVDNLGRGWVLVRNGAGWAKLPLLPEGPKSLTNDEAHRDMIKSP